MSDPPPFTMQIRAETLEAPRRLKLWVRFGDQPDDEPVVLNEREELELSELVLRAGELVNAARRRALDEGAAHERVEPLYTDPFALRPERDDEL